MQQYLPLLKRCPLFFEIDPPHVLAMLTCFGARVSSYKKKETIFAEGDPAKYIGIVLSGSAQIVQMDYFGNRSLVSGIEPSELFAEAFACAETSALPVSFIACEDSKVMLIDCHRILYSCSNNCGFHQQMIFNLMKDIATKNLMFHQKMEITGKRTTREKLLTYLNFQAKKHGNNCFEIPFNRQELADYLEVDRSGLSAEISKLQKEGLLKSRKERFELLS